jgi:cobalamin-dependent methionine synthase I
MIIVGELINASRKAVGEAISAQDAEAIKKLAVDQHEAGANYIDVNAGIFVGQEAGYLQWLVKTVQGAVDAPCCIDSPDPKAIENALSVHKGTAMINSISLEKDRYNALLPVVAGTDLKVVALCMSDEGMPETTEDRVKIADQLINDLVKNNIPLDNIYVDPLVQPVSTKSTFGDEFLNAVDEITHNCCGADIKGHPQHPSCGIPCLHSCYLIPGDNRCTGKLLFPQHTRQSLEGRMGYHIAPLTGFCSQNTPQPVPVRSLVL